MKYKCEVVGDFDMETIIVRAKNSRKAVNRAKRKYLKRHGGKGDGLTGHVVTVWRWLPGWVEALYPVKIEVVNG